MLDSPPVGPQLPSSAEIDAALAALGPAHDKVEGIQLTLGALRKREEAVAIPAELAWELTRFARDLQIIAKTLEERADEIEADVEWIDRELSPQTFPQAVAS